MNLSEATALCIFYILHFTLMHQHWIAGRGTICNSKYIVLSIQDLGNGVSAFYGYFMLCINHGKNFTPVCSTFRHFILLWFVCFFLFWEFTWKTPKNMLFSSSYYQAYWWWWWWWWWLWRWWCWRWWWWLLGTLKSFRWCAANSQVIRYWS